MYRTVCSFRCDFVGLHEVVGAFCLFWYIGANQSLFMLLARIICAVA